MKIKQTISNLEEIVNLPILDFQNSEIPISKLAIQSRQKRVYQLKLRGFIDEEISQKTGFSLSTIEKDLHYIREKARDWYEGESIKDFCLSLSDSIILCDNAIEDLQILYNEYTELDSKLKILKMISEFEERKTKLYSKTKAVKRYLK